MEIGTKSDVVVVGGVAAGPKTAATLMRRNPKLKVTLFQKEPRMSYATCGMPYFASGDVNSFEELTLTPYGIPRSPEFFKKAKGFTAVPGVEITGINRERKVVTGRYVGSGETFEHGYGTLVLATGATPMEPRFPVAESPKIRSFTRPDDAIHFRQQAQTGGVGEAVILGGGFIGCELAEATAGLWGIQSTLIECEKQLLPYALDPEMARLVRVEMERQGIEVMTGSMVKSISLQDEDRVLTEVVTPSETKTIESDYVFLSIGVKPEVQLAVACGLEMGTTGGIKVDECLRTSDPDIYAGGDCIESIHQLTGRELYLPLGSLANRHGRVIAENIVGNKAQFPGVLGAFFVKVFDANVGSVGLSARAATDAGLAYREIWGAFTDKPEYYPESASFLLKMLYAPDSLQLLGLQAVGKGDICRRIDVLSTFLQHKATVKNLLDFEHGYAPPYSEALDPLHQLAGAALAQERGVRFVGPGFDLARMDGSPMWLDVRENGEVEAQPVSDEVLGGANNRRHIPLLELVDHLAELDSAKKMVILCRRGPRSYQAALILKAAGFDNVEVVSGGTTGLLGE